MAHPVQNCRDTQWPHFSVPFVDIHTPGWLGKIMPQVALNDTYHLVFWHLQVLVHFYHVHASSFTAFVGLDIMDGGDDGGFTFQRVQIFLFAKSTNRTGWSPSPQGVSSLCDWLSQSQTTIGPPTPASFIVLYRSLCRFSNVPKPLSLIKARRPLPYAVESEWALNHSFCTLSKPFQA